MNAHQSCFNGIRASSAGHSGDADLNPLHRPLSDYSLLLQILVRVEESHLLEVAVAGAGDGELGELEVSAVRRHVWGRKMEGQTEVLFVCVKRKERKILG